jgi:hypothetical protein
MHASAKYARSRQGAGMKSKALAAAVKRKEEDSGARIPKEIKDKVIKRAVALGIPVSVLIRKQLGGACADFRLRIDSGRRHVGGGALGAYPAVPEREASRAIAECRAPTVAKTS